MSDSVGHISGSPIGVSHLTKRFVSKEGKTVVALEDLSLSQVEGGQFVAVVGRSGCGKSTLLKIVAGLLEYENGEVTRGDHRVQGPSTEVGMVFQAPELVPWRTTLENLLLAAQLSGKKARPYAKRAEDLLSLVGLAGFESSHPYELSGGMQHRAAIARSLLLEPSIMLMDEPFAALDALTRDDLSLELQRIWMETGCTVLFVTHNIPEAVLLSDRVVVLSDRPGRLMMDISVHFERPRPLTIEGTPEFAEIVNEVRAAVHQTESHTGG